MSNKNKGNHSVYMELRNYLKKYVGKIIIIIYKNNNINIGFIDTI